MNFIGETAALVTAVCWAVTGIFFTIGGRRVGAWIVNLTRLTLALLILFVIHRVWIGTWLPQNAGTLRWSWLALSGVIGLTLGDALLFSAHIHIGPRLTSLLMSSVPIITVVVAWVFLEERLIATDVFAVLITTGGIAWVVLERNQNGNSTKPRDLKRGILYGLGGAVGQALGLITSRIGLDGEFSAISATLIRMLAATVGYWLLVLIVGRAGQAVGILRADRRAIGAIVAGTLVGSVMGVTLSLVAIQNAHVGIASTLMALAPIAMIPLVWIAFLERASVRSVVGTIVALFGVAIIFLI